jgi:hypothetical protein
MEYGEEPALQPTKVGLNANFNEKAGEEGRRREWKHRNY